VSTEVWERTPPESQTCLLEQANTIHSLTHEVEKQAEVIRLLTGQKFGPNSEKSKKSKDSKKSDRSTEDKPVGEAPEAGSKTGGGNDEGETAQEQDEAEEQPVIPPPPAASRGRKPFPEHLPRKSVVVDVPDAEKVCACGLHKNRMGQEESERLGITPARVFVWHFIRPQWVCPICPGLVDALRMPAPSPGPVVSEGSASSVLTGVSEVLLPVAVSEVAASVATPGVAVLSSGSTITEDLALGLPTRVSDPPIPVAVAEPTLLMLPTEISGSALELTSERYRDVISGKQILATPSAAAVASPLSVPTVSDAPASGLMIGGSELLVPVAPMTTTALATSYRPVVSIAPPPAQLIWKGIPSNGLLVYIIIAKVMDALPLYRQCAQFLRYGVDIKRATMCGWLIKVGQLLAPIMKALRQEILTGRLIHIDETEFQVLDEPGRAATTKSYMWVFGGGPPDKPAVEFQYHPTRSSDVPRKFLEGYHGDVVTDGYVGYEFLLAWTWITLMGCWVHVRRKFHEVIKACPPNLRGKGGIAQEALNRIRVLYRIEKYADVHKLSEDQRRELRQEKAKPVVTAMKTWLEDVQPKVPHTGLLATAVNYALDQWPRLEHYLELGYRPPDNNFIENLIRPFALGRKNWQFCATPEGATALAALYSLVATARANGLDPARYLRALFDQFSVVLQHSHPIKGPSPAECRALLPQYIDRQLLDAELPESALFKFQSDI
jgi:transposase